MALSTLAADNTNVVVVIDGKRIDLRAELRPQIGQRSVELLASCAVMLPNPKWGAQAQPKSMADAQKQSHLQLVFSNPAKIEIPIEKTTVQAREIVITLPLTRAGIWVRTDDGIAYFAKFQPTAAESLQKLLDEAQKP
ncbi:MAG: hypothetical protein ACTHLW_18830 [Verrucomicrobiota bacterium]